MEVSNGQMPSAVSIELVSPPSILNPTQSFMSGSVMNGESPLHTLPIGAVKDVKGGRSPVSEIPVEPKSDTRRNASPPKMGHIDLQANRPGSPTRAIKNLDMWRRVSAKVGKAAIAVSLFTRPTVSSGLGVVAKQGPKPPNYDLFSEILHKAPECRLKHELDTLSTLIKNVKFFNTVPYHVREELCRVMYVQDVPWAQKTVFKQGDKGDTFFIILLGSFEVRVTGTNGQRVNKVGALKAGESFGELALITDDPRSATIVSQEPSELICIERRHYEMAIKSMHRKEYVEKMQFLRGVSCKSSYIQFVWSEDTI